MEQEQGESAGEAWPEIMEFQPYRKAEYEQKAWRRTVYRIKRRAPKKPKEGPWLRFFYLAWVAAVPAWVFIVADDWFYENGYSEGKLVNISEEAYSLIVISLLVFVVLGLYVGYWCLFLKPQQRRRNKWEQKRRKRMALLWNLVIVPILFLILYVLAGL